MTAVQKNRANGVESGLESRADMKQRLISCRGFAYNHGTCCHTWYTDALHEGTLLLLVEMHLRGNC